jgi:hypothetical protein
MTKQIVERLTIRNGSDESRLAYGSEPCTKRIIERLKIRSVSDGSAWGWGPTRIT